MSPRRRGALAAALAAVMVLEAARASPLAGEEDDGPGVERVAPQALVPGREATLAFFGRGLEGAFAVWTSFACERRPIPPPAGAAAAFAVRPALHSDARFIGAVRLATFQGWSRPWLVALDEVAPLEGAVDRGRFTRVEFQGEAGERLSLDVLARRLGSELDPALRILAPDGRELLHADDLEGLLGDLALELEIAASGRHVLELRDAIYGFGDKHRFAVTIGSGARAPLWFQDSSPEASGPWAWRGDAWEEGRVLEESETRAAPLAIELPAILRGRFGQSGERDRFRLRVGAGERLSLRGLTRSLGAPVDLLLRLESHGGEPIAQSDPGGGDEGVLEHVFKEAAECELVIEELNGRGGGGSRASYLIAARASRFDFALSLEEDGAVARLGTSFSIKVKADRKKGFEGPIEIQLRGLPGPAADWRLEGARIEMGKEEATLRATVPPDLAPGTIAEIRIGGVAELNGSQETRRARSSEALKGRFPGIVPPPIFLDGVFLLAVAPPP